AIVQAARLDVAPRAGEFCGGDEHHFKDGCLRRDHLLPLLNWVEGQPRFHAAPPMKSPRGVFLNLSPPHHPSNRVCVAGCGAIGGVLAARLAAAGHEVSVLARGAQLVEICKVGLRLTDLAGTVNVKVAASDKARFGAQDVVFVSCKAHAMGSMLPLIKPLVGENTVVVPTINGIPWWYFQGQGGPLEGQAVPVVDPNGALLGALPWTRIVGCVVYMAAEVRAPGCIVAISPHRVILGEPSNQPSERAALLCCLLNAAGIAATATERIRDEIWTKLLGNLASSPLSVLTGATLEDQ